MSEWQYVELGLPGEPSEGNPQWSQRYLDQGNNDLSDRHDKPHSDVRGANRCPILHPRVVGIAIRTSIRHIHLSGQGKVQPQ